MKLSEYYIQQEKKTKEALIADILRLVDEDEAYSLKREVTYEIVDDQFNVVISSVNKNGKVTIDYMGDESEVEITELTFSQLIGILKDMELESVKN